MKKTKTENKNAAQLKAFFEANAPTKKELKYGEGDNEFVINVYPVLPFSARMEMVRQIVNGVFMNERTSVNDYVPEFLILLQKYTVVKFYTDLELPTSLDDMWLVLNYTSLYDDIVKEVGADEIADIFDAANKAIDTYRQYLAAKTDTNALVKKIGDMLGDLNGVTSEGILDRFADALQNLPEGVSLQDLLGGLIGNRDVKA